MRLAADLGAVRVRAAVPLGESEAYQLSAALDLYHYANPKLLVFTCAARLALAGERVGGAPGDTRRLVRGVPEGMHPMEMVDAEPGDPRLRRLFADLERVLALPTVNSDYRTLALWPDYLEAAWRALAPIVVGERHRRASDRLRDHALELPLPVALAAADVRRAGEDIEQLLDVLARFERLLPGLILNVALLALDGRDLRHVERSPFPAEVRP